MEQEQHTSTSPATAQGEVLSKHSLAVRKFNSSREAQEEFVAECKAEIEELVRAHCKLDFFPQKFVIVTREQFQSIIAQGGFPRRYSHYRFVVDLITRQKQEEYGLGKVYEQVINTDPCIAYLCDSNTVQDTRTVMAHVYFHNMFFKHNQYFRATDRKMLDRMANHAARIKRYQELHSSEAVERFIDCCISIEDLIDPFSVFIKRREDTSSASLLEASESKPPEATRFDVPSYMDAFVNPPEALRQEVAFKKSQEEQKKKGFPPEPERDVLHFLLRHAPLEPWQQDILSIIRDEAYYFSPQGMTKIMNEGWATYWHSEIMTKYLLPRYPEETVDYCEMNAGVIAQAKNSFNPYRLGLKLFRDIEDRWNKGKFGEEYERCRDRDEREAWDRKLGLGREQIYKVMQLHNDKTFIDEYLTPEFCAENELFTFRKNDKGEIVRGSYDFERVKQMFLQNLTNFGRPVLSVVNGNHENRGELVIQHSFDGRELSFSHAEQTLRNLGKIWSRPVHLVTFKEDGDKIVFSVVRDKCERKQVSPEFLAYYKE